MRKLLPGVVLLAVTLAPTLAAAQEDNAATAFALFEEGRHLVSEGKPEQACPKLLASEQLVAKVSTLPNLADCYERTGRLASAWVRYVEAGALAQRLGQADREAFAKERAAALEPKLPRLTIGAPPGGIAAGLTVKRDGAPVLAAVLGTAVPVDPGSHTIEATIPGKQPWLTTVEIAAGATSTVTIPAPTEPPTPVEPSPQARPSSFPFGTLGVAVGSAGLVGLGVGAVFGGVAVSKKNQADSSGCNGNLCSMFAGPLRNDALSAATASTVAFVAGGVLLAGGTALWLLAPARARHSAVLVTPSAGPGGGGIAVAGRW